MLTDKQVAEICAKAEEIQVGGSKWTAGRAIVELCDHIDRLKRALDGIESVRKMQQRNLETLADERTEIQGHHDRLLSACQAVLREYNQADGLSDVVLQQVFRAVGDTTGAF